MKNDSYTYNAVAGVYRTAFAISALILSFIISPYASANYIYNHSTGVWMPTSSTVLAPPNSTSPFVSSTGVPPNPRVNNGAFTTTSGGSFGSAPVNGSVQRVPVTINGTVTKPNVNKALSSRLLRGGLAGVAVGYGVETLLSSIGALIDPNGGLSTATPIVYNDPPAGATITGMQIQASWPCTASWTPPPPVDNGSTTMVGCVNGPYPQSSGGQAICGGSQSGFNGMFLVGWNINGRQCYYSDTSSPLTYTPITQQDLDNAITNDYQADPSDYPLIVSEPSMRPTVINVEPIPTLNFPSVTTTYTDLDTGQTITSETNIWHDYDISNNNSEQPKIEGQETKQTDTYTDGIKTSESTTTSSSGVATGVASGSAPINIELDIPTDCDFMPTVCAFIDWFKQEPTEPDDDLTGLLREVPIVNEIYTITGGIAACPAPLVLDLAQFGGREVSYQPLCDLATTMKPLYLALMAFAAAVMLHRSINRV